MGAFLKRVLPANSGKFYIFKASRSTVHQSISAVLAQSLGPFLQPTDHSIVISDLDRSHTRSVVRSLACSLDQSRFSFAEPITRYSCLFAHTTSTRRPTPLTRHLQPLLLEGGLFVFLPCLERQLVHALHGGRIEFQLVHYRQHTETRRHQEGREGGVRPRRVNRPNPVGGPECRHKQRNFETIYVSSS